jgi:hypothetical protein
MESIIDMIKRRGYGVLSETTELYKDNVTDKNYVIHPGKIFVYDELKIKKEHGSVFTAICFVSYRYPKVKTQSIKKRKERKKKYLKKKRTIKRKNK